MADEWEYSPLAIQFTPWVAKHYVARDRRAISRTSHLTSLDEPLLRDNTTQINASLSTSHQRKATSKRHQEERPVITRSTSTFPTSPSIHPSTHLHTQRRKQFLRPILEVKLRDPVHLAYQLHALLNKNKTDQTNQTIRRNNAKEMCNHTYKTYLRCLHREWIGFEMCPDIEKCTDKKWLPIRLLQDVPGWCVECRGKMGVERAERAGGDRNGNGRSLL
ncbi:hypothetical protein VTL71DRAFT_14263 [Oculimacula yallundae]|uniref:Uncharacterized protein n=1 Tax=Oculimacula yallundae TaxID=86028 RepID=A0ABR4CIJ7_9HELO